MQLKFCEIYDAALIVLTLVCAYMIFKDDEKNMLSKLLIMIDLLLVIRTLTITKLLKKGIMGQSACDKEPKKKKKQRVIVLNEEDDDDDTEDIEQKKNAEGFRSFFSGKVGAK